MQDSEVKSYVEFVQFLLTSRPSLREREKVQNLASFFDHIAFDALWFENAQKRIGNLKKPFKSAMIGLCSSKIRFSSVYSTRELSWLNADPLMTIAK